jgi:phosphoglycerol transferase MdoB-like AlkP superfamily enzyme
MLRVGLIAIFQGAGLAVQFFTEYSLFAITLALLTWALVNFVFLFVLRRPAVAAALSFALIGLLVLLSQFKHGIVWMTLTFLDVLLIDADTIAYFTQIFPQVSVAAWIAVAAGIPLLALIWWVDPLRIPRRWSALGAAACLAIIVPLSLAVPETADEPFQGVNHVSSFSRSGVFAVSQLMTQGWIDAADAVPDPVEFKGDRPCRPDRKLPTIIVILDESSFDASVAPDIRLPPGYVEHFQSYDGVKRLLAVEATGGPTWYSEYNVLTGLPARSYGLLKYYVTRIAAEHISRGLPNALRRCGYRTYSLYPARGDFLSARRFQTHIGIENFIDQAGMGASVEINPDRFFYEQAEQLIARDGGDAPQFIFTYLTANHFPWSAEFRPDLTPDWKAPGNTAEIDEYLRRQTMSARDYSDFLGRLRREFPDRPFLIVRFGDHQPAISTAMLEPQAAPRDIARKVRKFDPRYFTTYYAIDMINFTPADMSSALPRLEAAHLPIVIQEVAGVPLDRSFVEQKTILQRCAGRFYDCRNGAESRRFYYLLIQAGLLRGLR